MVVCGSPWLVRDPNETPSMRAWRGRDMMSDEWTPGDAISEARSCVIRLPLTYRQTDARATSALGRADHQCAYRTGQHQARRVRGGRGCNNRI